MDTFIANHRSKSVRSNLARNFGDFIESHTPRRCMVISIGLILAGFCIPVLAAIQLFPFTLLIGFAGFSLTAGGSVMSIIFCGEI